VGLRLWRCPADVTLQVLCLLHSSEVCALILACKTTRAACSIQNYVVMPHLILSSKIASAQLKRVWLPRTLWLEGRDLDAAASKLLLDGLECTGAQAARALVTLDLRNTKLFSPISLVSVARSCRNLRSLNVSRTRLRDLGACHLLNGLVLDPFSGCHSPHTALKVLSLEDNRLTAAVGVQLARVVVDTPLEVLLLASNELGDEGVEAIAAALVGRPRDHFLRHDCLAQVHHNVKLTRLDVSRNRIGCAGVAALISSLSNNRIMCTAAPELRILEAGGNESIGQGLTEPCSASHSLTSGLQAAQGLEQLHLWKCGLGDSAYSLIAECLPPNATMVNLATNPFSASLRKMIMDDIRGIVAL